MVPAEKGGPYPTFECGYEREGLLVDDGQIGRMGWKIVLSWA